MTLTELLVVVSIVVILAGILVPLMQPVLKGQNTREAARQISVFLSGAQARAIEKGQPVGVWIERASHYAKDPRVEYPTERWFTAYKLYLAEQPAPYTGDIDNTMAIEFNQQGNPDIWNVYLWMPFGAPGGSVDPSFCPGAMTQTHPGDFIQFEYRGPRYRILDRGPAPLPASNDTIAQRITFEAPGYVSMTPAMQLAQTPKKYVASSSRVPFTVFRQPVKSATAPIELPNNVGLDLSVSGTAHYGDPWNSPTSFRRLLHPDPENSEENWNRRLLTPEHDIVIMFSPQGGLDHVYYVSHDLTDSFAEKPLGNLSLLVARDDKIGKDLSGQPNIDPPAVSDDVFEDFVNFKEFQKNFFEKNIKGPMGEASMADTTNLWVTVSSQSGRVFAAPNQGLPRGLNISGQRLDARSFVAVARFLADQGQSVGGR